MKLKSISILVLMVLFFAAGPSLSHALCVKAKNANLRQGPGLNYKKIWEVYKYMPFKQLGKKGDWLRIQDMDGDIYWIFKPLTTTAFKCAAIKKNKTNLRSGPGTDFKKVNWSPVDKYFSVKILSIKGDWVRVVDSVGDKAWVFKPLIWIQ